MKLGAIFQHAKHRARLSIYHIPWIYLPLARFKRTDGEGSTIVTRATDLVVEAFPRSGNTFAVAALRLAETRKLDIAHHFHAPAQLIRAARLHKPTLLIVRWPRDAVLSQVLRQPKISIALSLHLWITFHRRLRPYRDSFVVATFDQVTTDFGAVIDQVNRRFGITLPGFDHTEGNVAACFDAIEARNTQRLGRDHVDEGSVSRPSTARRESKRRLVQEWQSAELAPQREAAERLYAQLVGVA